MAPTWRGENTWYRWLSKSYMTNDISRHLLVSCKYTNARQIGYSWRQWVVLPRLSISDIPHEDRVPVGAVVSSCDVTVDLQSSLVVYVSLPVTLHSFGSSSTTEKRLNIEREQLQRPVMYNTYSLQVTNQCFQIYPKTNTKNKTLYSMTGYKYQTHCVKC